MALHVIMIREASNVKIAAIYYYYIWIVLAADLCISDLLKKIKLYYSYKGVLFS